MEVVTSTERIVKTFSCTEMIIIRALAEKLTDEQAELVMSEIADKAHVSRSNTVVLLSKLSAAGVLENRSLGMRGMYIKVLNREAFDEIVREVSA